MSVDVDVADVQRASELHARARTANSMARPAVAARLAWRGLKLLGIADAASITTPHEIPDVDLATRLLITAAKSEAELHGLERGLTLLALAEQLANSAGNRMAAVVCVSQRGLLFLRFGAIDRALADLTAAEHDLDVLPPLDRCAVLLNRGAVHLDRLDLARATADLARCARAAKDAELVELWAMAEHNRGYAEFLRGNLPDALDAMNAAVRSGADLPMGVSGLDRARVLLEAGLTREADLVLAEAAVEFARASAGQDLAETEVERARVALVDGNVAAARVFAARARDRFRRRGNDRWRHTAELVLLQGDLAAGRPGSRLVGPAIRLREELAAAGSRLEAQLAGLIAVEALLSAGRRDDALAQLAELAPAGRRDPITARLHARLVRARCDLVGGRTADASRQARAGLDELASYQATFGSIDLQTASAVHGRRLAELGVVTALRSGRAERVLAAAERARAVSSRMAVVRPPSDPEAAALLTELRKVVEAAHAAGVDEVALAGWRKRRVELEREITARRWTLAGSGTARTVVGVDQIRAGLDGASLVMFIVADGELHAVVVGTTLRLHHLGPFAAIVEEVRRLRADLDVLAQPLLSSDLRATVLASARRSVGRLDAALLGPVAGTEERLVVVPTGVLGQLPWNTLPSLRQVPIVVAPSATAWLTARDQSARRRQRGVYAIGGPGMSHGAREVGGVAAAWPAAEVRTGAAADRRALSDALAKGTVVHVAAHGLHQTENPLFSSLRVADGLIFAHELDRNRRTAEHVVLSACELGLTTVRPGDEALGLTSVLLRLGSRSVVSGVARVGDELAAETMIDYHRRLAGGADSAQALADAVAAAPGPTPFVCFGSAWTARASIA